MGFQGTIVSGLRGYPYTIPNYAVMTAAGGLPPAFNQQDFYCSIRASRRGDANGVPIHDADIIITPQGPIQNILNPTTTGGSFYADAAHIGDYSIYFPNTVTGNPARRPVYTARRNRFNPATLNMEVQSTYIYAPSLYFTNSGQRPFAMNPYRFSSARTIRLAGKACPAHCFEDTAGPDNINPAYIFNNAPLSFKVPLEVDLPPTNILGQFSMYGCPYGQWDMIFFDRNSTIPTKQLNWYLASGFNGQTTRTDRVEGLFNEFPDLALLWDNSVASDNNYRINIWPYGWTILFYTNGLGPNGPHQKFELAVTDPFMRNYALVRFNPEDATAAALLNTFVHKAGDVKLDDQGLYWLHSGDPATQYQLATSFDVNPLNYARVQGLQLPAITLPCFAPCGPFTIPGG